MRRLTQDSEPVGSVPTSLTQRVEAYEARVRESGGHLFGRPPGPDSVQLVSNDYLSLATHPEIIAAQTESLAKQGNGLLMSSVFVGEGSAQRKFERRLAAFMGAEDGLLGQSGWCTNSGLLQAIADRTAMVYLDVLAHMSLWEGANSAGAPTRPFRHNDPASLERSIRNFGPGIVVADAIYSTNGSIAPLTDIVEIAHGSGCIVVIDESHSLGTHGPQGQGLVVELGLNDKVHFRTASLAKAFAGRGGIVVGPARLIEFTRYESRPAIFSSTVLPHEIVGFDLTLDIIMRDGWRRDRLVRNANHLRQGLAELGYNVSESASQIISIEVGRERDTFRFRDLLEERGVFGSIFTAPATPKSRSLVRFSVNCDVTREELDRVIAACRDVRDLVDFRDWPSTRRLREAKSAVA